MDQRLYCVIIGYANNRSAYWILVHKSEILDVYIGTIIESRNAVFFKDIFLCKEKEINLHKRTYNTANRNHQEDGNNQVDEELGCSRRQMTHKTFDLYFLTFLLENYPRTFNEVMSMPKAICWKEVI